MKRDIGIIGLGVMGRSLALNMARHGFEVAVYNYTRDLTDEFMGRCPLNNIAPFYDLKDFVENLARPRKIFMMVTAGKVVDSVIESLIPLLEEGDIVMDGGNSFFEDTRRRYHELKEKGIDYLGIGVSGGEEGALHGPALMPGGNKAVYGSVKNIFESIAAKAEDGAPCCTYIGEDGAGHYVKMVHNGIEYADMQLIAESYLMLKFIGGFSNAEIGDIFQTWNESELKSYLLEISAKIMKEKDDLGAGDLIDKILDVAGNKGTGRWTSIAALEQGVVTTMIAGSGNARLITNMQGLRHRVQQLDIKRVVPFTKPEDLVEKIRQALYLAKLIAYAQGFSLYKNASDLYGWNLDLAAIAKIFRAGCIIQADFLNEIAGVYESNPQLANLVEAPYFLSKIESYQVSLREVITYGIMAGVPIPVLSNSIAYLDGLSSKLVGANLIQAQRDFFGAHTFRRTDREGSFHHAWQR